MNHRQWMRYTAIGLLLILLLPALSACGNAEPSAEEVESFAGPGKVAYPGEPTLSIEEAFVEESSTDGTGMLTEADTGAVNFKEADIEGGDGSGIYSYIQTVSPYEEGNEWAGEWCYLTEEGSSKRFATFGCGLCCLANICSTLTEYPCDPGEMYDWAKQCSDYAGDGAISWTQIETVGEQSGFPGELCTAGDYESFQADMADSKTMLCLISSYYDETIWQNLPGHYITIWEYDAETDTVFLTDSSRIVNNRSRVALENIYKALDLSDSYQYFRVPKA